MSPSNPNPQPPDIQDPDIALRELLERSRAIQLVQSDVGRVKLSKFTLRQLSRRKRLKRKTRVVRKRLHYKTKQKLRKQRRARRVEKYYQLKTKHGKRWQVTMEEWTDVLWPYLVEGSLRVGTYEPGEPMTVYSLWIEQADGTRLWEGAEERLRELGCLV